MIYDRKQEEKKTTPFFSTEKKGEIVEEQLLEGQMNRLNRGEYISHHKKKDAQRGRKICTCKKCIHK